MDIVTKIHLYLSLPRGCSKSYRYYIWNTLTKINKVNKFVHEKYYKGTLNPLYFPYVNHELKICHHVKVPYYFGLHCSKVYFDEFILDTNDCHEKWEKNDGKWSIYKSIMGYLEK